MKTAPEIATEPWRLTLRNGFLPQFSDRMLEALATACREGDPRLVQGNTTIPPPLTCVQDWPVEAACAIGFCGWQGEDLETVGEVEEFFARLCREADQRLGDWAACRWFPNWFDETPRDEMLSELLSELTREIERRTPCFTVE